MAATFDNLTSRARDWSLDDFVTEVNRLLPEVVPSEPATRAKLAVNARLVRHYTTEGVLPKPLKEGVEARYDTDHLVRMLALRRLLLEGYPSGVAGTFLRQHDREALARFLLGEFQLELDLAPGGLPVATASLQHLPASVREQLAAMRRRAGLPPIEAEPESAEHALPSSMAARPDDEASLAEADIAALRSPPMATHLRSRSPRRSDPRASTTYTRYELLDGLELHLSDDYPVPTTPAAWTALRDAILARLEQVALERTVKR